MLKGQTGITLFTRGLSCLRISLRN